MMPRAIALLRKLLNLFCRNRYFRDQDHLSACHTKLYKLIRKSFHDEEWRLFYFKSIIGCRVIDLCKLDDL